MKFGRRARYGALIGTMLSTAFVTPAWGQDAGGQQSASQGGGLREIVVTARRREEAIQSVPIAVTAFDTQALKEANVTRMDELGVVAPALVITPSQSATATPAFAIRGQRNDSGYVTNDPSVGIYMNEAVQTRVYGLAASLFDLQSVEVLKGPQGTLFGRNTTGGAILFNSKRPVLGETSGYFQMRAGNLSRFDAQGAVTLPLGENAGIRLAYNHQQRSGYVTNINTGGKLGGEHNDSVRATVLLEPSDTFKNTFIFDWFHANQTGSPLVATSLRPGSAAESILGPLLDDLDLGYWETGGEFDPVSKGRNLGLTNITEIEVSDSLTIKNIANYRRIRSHETMEMDGTGYDYLSTIVIQETDQYSDELQFQYAADRLNAIMGLYWFKEDSYNLIGTSVFASGQRPRTGNATNDAYSIFAQADYDLTDTVTATLGGRYTWDKRHFDTQIYGSFAALEAGNCTFCGERDVNFEKFTYTAILSWQMDSDKLLYVTTRRGYRAGGTSASASSDAALTPFNPETITDYEIGLKADWHLGGASLRTNIAAFHANYKDIQRSVIGDGPNGPITSIFNAGAAHVDGGEFEAQLVASDNLELFGNVAYVKPNYTEFLNGGVDVSDNTFAWIPKWTYRIGGTVHIPVGDTSQINATVDLTGRSKVYFGEFNNELASQEGYALVNGRLELTDVAGSDITFALWGRNLTGKKYLIAEGDQYGGGLGYIYSMAGTPREYGVEAIVRF